MDIQRVRDAMEALLAANPEAADRDELAEHVRTVRKLRNHLDAFEVRCARRGRELVEDGRAEPPASMFANQGGQSGKQAATAAERERVASQANSFEDALGEAEVSAGHLDALALATKGLDEAQLEAFLEHEDDLLAAARTMTVDAFARECRGVARQIIAASTNGAGDADELDRQRAMSKVKRWVDKRTGMHHTHLELDPVSDAKVWAAIDAQLAAVRWVPLGPPSLVGSIGLSVARVPCEASSRLFGDDSREPRATLIVKATGRRLSRRTTLDVPQIGAYGEISRLFGDKAPLEATSAAVRRA